MQPTPSRGGRGLMWLGVACAVVGPFLYYGQLTGLGLTFNPWYVPALATVGVVLVLMSLQRRVTLWRCLALLAVVVLAAGGWWFMTEARLPAYAGPVAAGESFPDFAAKRADGTPFTRADLPGDRATALVFFRGHW